MLLNFLTTLIICSTISVEGAKILGLFPVSSPSHLNGISPVIKELASRGHDITFISTTKLGLKQPNVKEIDIPEIQKLFQKIFNPAIFEEATESALTRVFKLRKILLALPEVAITSSVIQKLIKDGMLYDLVLVHGYMNEGSLMVAHLLGKHFIMVSPGMMSVFTTYQESYYSSFIPNKLFTFTSNMNFIERLQNVIGTFISGTFLFYVIPNNIEKIVLKHVPNALPIAEARDRISLLLLNSDPVLQNPYPKTPRIQAIGGMHLRKAHPLPKELTDFIENAEDEGFILFTLGSMIPSQQLPEPLQQAFLTAFSRLKQNIIWKYNGTRSDRPKNVMFSPWLPQQDLLGHPKIRLFISHGGLLGSQEAVYHGCPVLGMPIFADQPGNLARIKELGIGEPFERFYESNADGIYEAITRIIRNPKYKENAEKYSAIMRDQPEQPEKRGAFWVEYVLRHKGAAHLRSAGDNQSFIQYYLIDVFGFIIATSVIILSVLVLTVKFLIGLFINRKKKPDTQREKKKTK